MTTETTPAHTPTPWCLGNHGTLMKRDVIGNPERHIAECVWPTGDPQGKADMAYIVTCVNSHAELLSERDALLATTAKLREALELARHYVYCAGVDMSGSVADGDLVTVDAALSLPTPSVTK